MVQWRVVSSDRLQELDQRLAQLGIRAEELVEQFTRAGGPGGQHVNRTATAVQLKHLPSGVVVRAEGERSQLRNRIAAREELLARIESARAKEQAERIAARERARRQRRRPPPAARKKQVTAKRERGTLKRLRGQVRDEE